MEKLRKELEEYTPYNQQEEHDLGVILSVLDQDDILERNNLVGHLTASSWVVNKDHTKVLMAYHLLYNSFAWLGGHADGDSDLRHVACKETTEESGVKVLNNDFPLFSVEILTVDGHMKRGSYVPSHLHYNLTYLIEADEESVLSVKEDENSAVKWIPIDEVLDNVSEPWMNRWIYSKLNEKVKKLKG